MNPFDQIQFDQILYCSFNRLCLLLYHTEGISPVIPIQNFNSLDFVKTFEDSNNCQNEISNNNQNNYYLFTLFNNIQRWSRNNYPKNLDKILIFHFFDNEKEFIRDWMKRYTSKVDKIISFNELERELLIFGLNYLNDLCSLFQNNPLFYQQLRQKQIKLTQALLDVLQQEKQS